MYVYVYAHIQPPSWGVMFENTLPPPKKKGGRQPSSPKQNSEVLKPSKSITCRFVFFCGCRFNLRHFPPQSCWKLPSLIQHSFNPFQDLDSACWFSMLFLNVKLYQLDCGWGGAISFSTQNLKNKEVTLNLYNLNMVGSRYLGACFGFGA